MQRRADHHGHNARTNGRNAARASRIWNIEIVGLAPT
jgi:hypothetical protein